MDPLPPRRGGAPAAPALSPALAAAKALLDRDVKDILTVRARASFDPGAVWATAPLLYPRRIPWPRGPREQPRGTIRGGGGGRKTRCVRTSEEDGACARDCLAGPRAGASPRVAPPSLAGCIECALREGGAGNCGATRRNYSQKRRGSARTPKQPDARKDLAASHYFRGGISGP